MDRPKIRPGRYHCNLLSRIKRGRHTLLSEQPSGLKLKQCYWLLAQTKAFSILRALHQIVSQGCLYLSRSFSFVGGIMQRQQRQTRSVAYKCAMALLCLLDIERYSVAAFCPQQPKLVQRHVSFTNLLPIQSKTCLWETKSSSVEEETYLKLVEKKFHKQANDVELVTLELTDHRPLGCTVEESLDIESDDHVVFVSKVVEGGNAEAFGMQVGDVLVAMTGLFDEVTPVLEAGLDKIKGFVGSVKEEDPLTVVVARGTGVLERHETALVGLCQTAGASDKEVENCVTEFLAAGYDDDDDFPEDTEDLEPSNDDDLIDNMMNLWADELPADTSSLSGITDGSNNSDGSASKAKPWSSRSSPSGTFVRDPVTGEMRNIDA